MTSQQDTELSLDEILMKVLLVWKQDYPKPDGDSGLLMDEYFQRLEDAKTEAIQALTSWKDKEVTKARIDELKKITKETIEKPITPENQNDSTWQGGYNFARNSLKRYKLDRIKSLQSQGGKNE